MKKHSKKLVAAVTLAASLAVAPSVFALNTPGDGTGNGNKPFSFVGYEWKDNTTSADTLQLNFNKALASPAEVLDAAAWKKIINVNDGTNDVDFDVAISAGNDYDDTNHYSKGTRVTLTFKNAQGQPLDLTRNALYNVKIKNLLIDANGISLGNFANRKNLEFKFRTSQSDGTYPSGDANKPYVTFIVRDTSDKSQGEYQNVSWESDMTVIFDRPHNATLSSFETNLAYGYEKKVSGTWTDVSLSESSGSYEGYPAHHNNALTTFFFPMTNNGFSSPCFNRSQSANDYQWVLPTFTDTSSNAWSSFSGNDAGSMTFQTVANDYPGWELNGASSNAALDVSSPAAHELYAYWYPTPISPTPTGYKVFVTTGDKFTGTYTEVTSNITFDTDIDGNITASLTNLTPGNYFLRVAPYNATGTVGLSIANSTAVSVAD